MLLMMQAGHHEKPESFVWGIGCSLLLLIA